MELPGRNIIVGGDHNYPPFEYLDNEGNPAGYNVDMIHAIAREMGLNVEIRLGPWTQITTMLEHGEIDLIQGMTYSAERDKFFDFSQAHTVHQHVAIARQSGDGGRIPGSEAELRGKRIVVQAGDIMHEFAIERETTVSCHTSRRDLPSLNGRVSIARSTTSGWVYTLYPSTI
ncbi:MAG: transporter substrate-binding domain-containing protein [Spirochaetia bacterium]